MSIIVTRDTLDTLAEFDRVFRINPDGTLDFPDTALREHWAPERVEDDVVDGDPDSPWKLVNGFSGQYGYAGPVMHSSECLGGGMADHVLGTPGLYVVMEAYVSQERSGLGDDEYDEDEPAGWVLLHQPGDI